ncbi:MAG: hypothetical protein JSS64_07960 [Bacteroidetes bacterium]|nr:hypothetical protein [Bacteroidota bacterium]
MIQRFFLLLFFVSSIISCASSRTLLKTKEIKILQFTEQTILPGRSETPVSKQFSISIDWRLTQSPEKFFIRYDRKWYVAAWQVSNPISQMKQQTLKINFQEEAQPDIANTLISAGNVLLVQLRNKQWKYVSLPIAKKNTDIIMP